jgi:hypothetical protein
LKLSSLFYLKVKIISSGDIVVATKLDIINNYKGNLFFYVFNKNDASKNKVKQNLKQSKGCACETSLAEVFFFPGNGARKLVDGAVLNGARKLVDVLLACS